MNRFAKLATAAAASIALATPAQAGDDAAKVIAGVLGIALLGAVLSDLSNDDPAPVVTPTPTPPGGPRHYHPRPLPRQVLRYTLPRQCVLASGHSPGGNALLSKGCLNRNYAFAGELPKTCEIRYWSHSRSDLRRGYALNCLERHGYRLTRY